MNMEWLARASAQHNLVRLPNGVCCGICGLVASTDSPEGEEDDEQALASRAWAEMEAHVRREHCAACCRCGKEAAGIVELATGEIASWLRRSRTRSPLDALRANRREQARSIARARRPTGGQQWQARVDDGFFRYYGLGTAWPLPPPSPPPQTLRRQPCLRCDHAVCEQCAAAMAKAAAPTLASMKILVKCPAKDCKAGIDSGILALFLPPGGALESTFRCVACGEDRPERDKVSLHNPERPTFRPQMSYPRYRVGTRSMLRFGEDDSDDTSPTVVDLERLSPVSMPSDLSAAPPAKRARVDPNVEHERTVVASTTGILRSPDGSDEERRHLAKTVGQERRAAGTMRSSEENAVPVACEMCAPCAKRWLAVQSRDGVACVRCPTPQCRATLSRETLELLLTPDGYKEHLDRTKKSFELRLQELRRSARSTSIATANAATAEAARSLAPRSSLAHATTSHGNKAEGDDDGTLAFLKWAGDATRACPECHVIIYRSEGCAHMSCACGAEFNWDRAERILHDAPSSSPAAAAAAIQQRSPATVPFEDVWRPDFGDLDVLLRNNTNNPNSGSGNPDRAIPDDPAELRRALIAEQARTAALRDEIARTSRNAIRRYELARREATRRQSLRDSSSPS